jgi:hypothetical protein
MSSSYFLLAFTSSYLFEALTGEAGPNRALKMERKNIFIFSFQISLPIWPNCGKK